MEQEQSNTVPAPQTTTQHNPLLAAIVLQQEGKLAEAEALFRQILLVAPTNAPTLYSLALILLNSGRLDEALQLATAGVDANPDFAPLSSIQGAVFQALDRRDDALASYDRALSVDPKLTEVLVNSGVVLRDLRRHHEALDRFRRVLEIDPDHVNALSNYGILLTEFKLGQAAVEVFERLLKKSPDYQYGLGLLCYERLHLCDWTDLDVTTRAITDAIREGRKACKTLGYMALSDDAADHFRCARIFAEGQHPKRPSPLCVGGHKYGHERTRVAYISPDLREHPVGHLMVGVIEAHDKARFETIAISLGIDDGSRIRARMVSAFEHFIDAKDMTARQIAELMRQMEVDIAIDLAGYTSDARTDVFLYRPAPVQVNYLGYPGTMALDCYDYIIADRTVLPEEHRAWYTEEPAYLEHCYLPIASGTEVATPLPRSAYGLPDEGFVFCAFSHDYKIHPRMFDLWMRLLNANPGSVLWLVSRNEVSQQNLRKAAQARGLEPARLVFASRVPRVEDHLARYLVADLFLDTWPYNAHTTAADALLAGLPVVTYKGGAFPSRVAASLLSTLGFDELVTESFDGYFELADGLARDPNRLKALRERLSPAALYGHPFLGQSFTRSLEKVLEGLTAAGAPAARTTAPKSESAPTVAGGADDPVLNKALELIRRHNLPQAEMYVRRCLASNPGNPAASRVLDDIRRGYGIADGFELSERATAKSSGQRYLLIKAWGYGFWSEGHHVAGHLLLAELTGRTPIVHWGENCLFRREGDDDAFGHFFQLPTATRLDDVPADATIYPPKWNRGNLRKEDVNKWEGEGSRLAAQYLFDRPETLVVSDFYSTLHSLLPWIGRSSRYYGMSEDAIYSVLFQKYLKPVPRIGAQVEAFADRHMRGRPWVAVHMRGSDKIYESPQLARTNETYFAFVDRIVELNPSIGVFLLTDSAPMVAEFSGRYGGRLLCTPSTRSASNVGVHLSGRDGVANGDEVLVDALLALRCAYFVGNKESNVSLAIASMRDWPQGFLFLLGEGSVRSENLMLHNRPTSKAPLKGATAPKVRTAGAKTKVLFFNDWHNGDVHMSRPYVVDLMKLLGDCDYHYHHRNNPKLLADLENLSHTPVKIAADVVVDTWLGQHHYKGMSGIEMVKHEADFLGCNFPSYYEVMRKVYASLGLAGSLQPIEHYLPTIDYRKFAVENVDRYFSGEAKRPRVLICNNTILSGQAPPVDFGRLVATLAAAFSRVDFLITNNDNSRVTQRNVFYCGDIIDHPEMTCDLNEISYISAHCDLIVGRSSGPYSFSVTKENMACKQFFCICNARKDSWFLEKSNNIDWTNDPSLENLTERLSNLMHSLGMMENG